MQDELDKISIIMPVYNGEKYIVAAVDSIIKQTHSAIELIIIDDGSEDLTAKKLTPYLNQYKPNINSAFSIQYYKQTHKNQAHATNIGIQLASNQYISFLDSDDLYTVDKIKNQIAILKSHQVDMTFGYVQEFISEDLPPRVKQARTCKKNPMPGYVAAAGLFHKYCFDKVGLLNTKWRVGFFVDWYMRAKELNLKDHLSENIVLHRRIHEHNHGILAKDYRKDYAKIISASLARRKEFLQDN